MVNVVVNRSRFAFIFAYVAWLCLILGLDCDAFWPPLSGCLPTLYLHSACRLGMSLEQHLGGVTF